MNAHVYPSTIENESRMLKIAKSLTSHGVFKKIELVGKWKLGLPEREPVNDKITIVRIKPIYLPFVPGIFRKFFAVLTWYIRTFNYLLFKPVDCINCHSLPVLPLTATLKVLKRTPLVYDTHELETETATCKGIKKVLFKITEQTFIGFSDAICVVNKSIADWYKQRYNLNKVWVVKNVPNSLTKALNKTDYLKQKFNIPNSDLVFIYQGLLSRGRGINVILESFQGLNNKHIVFMGYGEFDEKIKKTASEFQNIHFHEAVKPSEIPYITSSADVGISLIENICLSYYFSLPNKLYEYASSGIPSLASSFPEMKAFIDKNNAGWTIKPEINHLKQWLSDIDANKIQVTRDTLKQSPHQFGWEYEEPELFDIYKSLKLTSS